MKILKSLLLILVTLFLCTGCSGDNFLCNCHSHGSYSSSRFKEAIKPP